MQNWYQVSAGETMKYFGVSSDGLKQEQVKASAEKWGLNQLAEGKKKSVFQIFLSQFRDLLVIILIAAAVISFFTGNIESTIVIVVVITLNATLGTLQHIKAEKSLASLKSLSAPSAKVMREGEKTVIPSKDVVPGDILLLEAGDLVVADGRIIESYSLQVNESSLTGESLSVNKHEDTIAEEVALGDRRNMVYSGSLITYGRAVAVATGTGMNTEIGKIASLMNETEEKKTPLQASLDQFSSRLAVLVISISALVFFLSIYRDMSVLDALMFAVALAVAAIPEALGSIVTIVQAVGTQKMAAENAIVKDLRAVESLGCVSVICSDKTGTLTQNKMTVVDIFADGRKFRPGDLKYDSVRLHQLLLYDAVLTNDSSYSDGEGIGDPTEYALLAMAEKIGFNHAELRSGMTRMQEVPFDSERKLMSTMYEIGGNVTVLTKGAVDVLLERTVSILTADGVRDMTMEDRKCINEQNTDFSRHGLRVLAFAYRELDAGENLSVETEKNFTFLGLMAMVDPPRQESAEAVADAVRAGIRPVMITGDHKVTATAIAEEIGIFRSGDLSLTGPELDALTDRQLEEEIEKISVYARVSPENKIRIVEAWQKRGNIVSMTGDGVNDAPALKKADIGVAMGITGTDVSKDAASMILADDNFATIIKAVANGRNVYKNIRNAVFFLLSGNTAGIITVLYTSLLALPVPFKPVHLLFINLLTDSLPALAIGMEPPEKNLLEQPPRDPKQGILTRNFMIRIIVQGGLIGICTIMAFYVGLRTDAGSASTMAFATLALARLLHGINCRSGHSIFKIGFRRNWYSLGAVALSFAILMIVLFVPLMHSLFVITPLTMHQVWTVAALAAAPTVLIQAAKIVGDFRRR